MQITDATAVAQMDAWINRVERLHSSPAIACQVLTILEDEDFDVGELVTCLERDPALASAVLRLVNSSYFGVARSVGSLSQAVMLLGSRSLRLAVLSFGLLKHLSEDTPAQVYNAFWTRSVTKAVVASLVARRSAQLRADEAHSAGLLSEVGMLLLAQEDTERFVELFAVFGFADDLWESERAVWGFDHSALGARLLMRWHLPEATTSAIASHRSEPVDSPLASHLLAADLLADALWTPGSPRAARARTYLEEEFGLSLDDYIDLATLAKQRIDETAALYHCRLTGEIDIDAVLQAARRQFVETALETALDLDSLGAIDQLTAPNAGPLADRDW